MKKCFLVIIFSLLCWFSFALTYSLEMQNAYNYAYNQKITTISSIEKANLDGQLTRIAMAKMLSNFSINVLWLQPDASINCSFSDVSILLDSQYNYWATQACQLWLMWIWNDWKKSKNFNPYWSVTRAQFATAFSRALSKFNWDVVLGWEPYYKWHLQYLKNKWIINNVSSPAPSSLEKRWNVMIMMYRMSKLKNISNGKNIDNGEKNVNNEKIIDNNEKDINNGKDNKNDNIDKNFDVEYTILAKISETWEFRELCNSKSANWCKQVKLSNVPQQYQIQIKSITPSSNTLRKIVRLNWTSLLNENDIYTFEISEEWVYDLVILVSDLDNWMSEETRSIRFIAKKEPIVWIMTITSAEWDEKLRKPIKEWFEPLTVMLDASKTEVNVEWDEIIYFTWDFGDWEIKRNIQNWIVTHTYYYDYANDNWMFQPKVSILTRLGNKITLMWAILNVKKWLITVNLSSTSHPSRQAPMRKEVTFFAEFDWLPEQMIWDFGDGSSPVSCQWKSCTEIKHTFNKTWIFSVKLSLDFEDIQQIDGTMDFKVYDAEY